MRSLLLWGLMAGVVPGLAQQTTVTVYASSTNKNNPSSTASSDDSKSSASTTAPSVIMVTVAIEPLTTTFIPPPTCTESRLSMMASPRYQIWNNEPAPLSNTKVTDCYPSQFIKRYTSAFNQSSSIAPLMSPLVCPSGWVTARQWDNAYIVCCASGYLLHPPETTVDADRPGYGGTCYSPFLVGQTATVTGYNSTMITATFPWVASSSADQAYAHPIDGFAMDLLASLTSSSESVTSTSSSSLATATATNDSSEDSSTASSSSISGGAIAGIVIGVLAGLALIILAVFLLIRRRRGGQHPPNTQIGELGGEPVMVYEHKPLPPAKDSPVPVKSPSGFAYAAPKSNPSASPVQSHSNAELDDASTINPTVASSIVSPVSRNQSKRRDMNDIELEAARARPYAELDAGWKGHEMS
ncbi:unnamed protein product [Clonostachys chloroleuca]|uniref:Uncharacterized protein n=1 Tax=Clonostachys chloroleuca TaxID=1926264 RepID=A0AA35LQB0_9HYPO|nr:unnamed protein product [Clonostachys chloroleuca]